MNTVIINNDTINLNSNLEESSFGKTNYFTLINEKGYLYNNKEENFSPWTFEGVNTKLSDDSKSYVYYHGSNPLTINSKTLLSFFCDNENKDELYKAVTIVIKAITTALKKDLVLPLVGGEGIIVDISEEKVLFLPETIFKYSTNILSEEEYFNKETAWLNSTIKDKAGMSYERALIVYKLLTTQYPYKETNEEKRNQDILDKNFLPIEVCFPHITPSFAKELNRCLTLASTSVELPGSKKKGVSSSALTIHEDFDFDSLNKVWEKRKSITDEELKTKVEEYLSNKKAKVEAQRKLRRNRTALLIALGVGVIIVIMTISGVKRQNSRYTTMGLESTDIIQNFFYGVNNKSLDVIQTIAHGDGPDKYVNKVTDVFLAEKQITSFTKDSPFFYPEKWMFTITNNDRFNIAKVFGITNLKIDGKDEELELSLNRRNEKPIPVTKENGEEYLQGETVTHNVEYYLLQTDLSNQNIKVEKVNDTQTFTYKNGKWLFTDIRSNTNELPIDTEEFKSNYFTALENNDGDVIKACDSIREKYPWLPTSTSLITEKASMY